MDKHLEPTRDTMAAAAAASAASAKAGVGDAPPMTGSSPSPSSSSALVAAAAAASASSAHGLEWRAFLIGRALENERNKSNSTISAKRTCAEISVDNSADHTNSDQSNNCILVPCLAKNMPSDHTLETAYFLIPADIRHGADLVCSHIKCRNAGAKFRYCRYCSGPVIRRNFSTRHDHSNQADSIREKEESDARAMHGIPDQVTTKKARHNDSTNSDDIGSSGASSKGESSECSFVATSASSITATTAAKPPERAAATSTFRNLSSSASTAKKDPGDVTKQDETAKAAPSVAIAVSTGDASGVQRDQKQQQLSFHDDSDSLASDDSVDVKRHFVWATLLAKRPQSNDKSDMSKWLMDVLSVSDGHGRLQSANDSSPTTDSSGNEKGEMPTDQSGTAGSSRTDGSSNESVDTPEINKASDTTPTDRSSNDNDNESSNDSSSEDMTTEND